MRTPRPFAFAASTASATFTGVRRVAHAVGIATVVVALALYCLVWGARALLRPAPGDWATTLHAGPVPIAVGVAALIQWGTTPWIARQLDGRTVTTRMGKKPTAATLKRFLVGPAGQEITGMCETPDGKVLFLNVQHPGEDTSTAVIGDPTKYQSHWPGNAGYGVGGANARPRAATVMVVKNDGGRVGS